MRGKDAINSATLYDGGADVVIGANGFMEIGVKGG